MLSIVKLNVLISVIISSLYDNLLNLFVSSNFNVCFLSFIFMVTLSVFRYKGNLYNPLRTSLLFIILIEEIYNFLLPFNFPILILL